MSKMGRPIKVIDKDEFEKLCAMQCTEVEISSFFNVDVDTLNKWCKKTYKKTFSEVFKVKREGGKASLRRTQWMLAQENATMSIWLGKQYLGQKDQMQVDQRNTNIEIDLGALNDHDQGH